MTTSRLGTVGVLAVGVLLAACGPNDDAATTSSSPSTTPTTDAAVGDPAYVTARVTTGRKPCGVVGAEGKIWVSNYGDSTLVSIDPATGEVDQPIEVGAQPCGLAYGA